MNIASNSLCTWTFHILLSLLYSKRMHFIRVRMFFLSEWCSFLSVRMFTSSVGMFSLSQCFSLCPSDVYRLSSLHFYFVVLNHIPIVHFISVVCFLHFILFTMFAISFIKIFLERKLCSPDFFFFFFFLNIVIKYRNRDLMQKYRDTIFFFFIQ